MLLNSSISKVVVEGAHHLQAEVARPLPHLLAKVQALHHQAHPLHRAHLPKHHLPVQRRQAHLSQVHHLQVVQLPRHQRLLQVLTKPQPLPLHTLK